MKISTYEYFEVAGAITVIFFTHFNMVTERHLPQGRRAAVSSELRRHGRRHSPPECRCQMGKVTGRRRLSFEECFGWLEPAACHHPSSSGSSPSTAAPEIFRVCLGTPLTEERVLCPWLIGSGATVVFYTVLGLLSHHRV